MSINPSTDLAHSGTPELIVQRAERSDLYSLLSFLDNHLPRESQIYTAVLFALFVRDASRYSVYFLQDRTAFQADINKYTAILVVNKEYPFTVDGRSKKKWLLCSWMTDEESLLTIYDAITFIDWSNDVVNVFYNSDHLERLHLAVPRCFSDARREFYRNNDLSDPPFDRYAMDIDRALKLTIQDLPEDVYIKSLERHHAQVVYDNWTFRECTTVPEMADEIDRMASAGIFIKENDQTPVSWITHHSHNGLGRLFTEERYRRRGYASLVIRYTAKKVAQAGYTPFVNIVQGNTASAELFLKIGFRLVSKNHVCVTLST